MIFLHFLIALLLFTTIPMLPCQCWAAGLMMKDCGRGVKQMEIRQQDGGQNPKIDQEYGEPDTDQ